MFITSLTQTQYRNYSNIHNQRNIGQTVEYSNLPINSNDKKLFLGLIDNSNNLHAATLILIKNVSPSVKEAYAPNGFLIDYSNFSLVETFTRELTKYLQQEKVTYLITNPMFKYKVGFLNYWIIVDLQYYISFRYTVSQYFYRLY